VQGITANYTNSALAGTGTASITGTSANPVVNVNFPNDVQSVSAGTVTNSGSTGTLTISGMAANPEINVNFPVSSGASSGFTWIGSNQDAGGGYSGIPAYLSPLASGTQLYVSAASAPNPGAGATLVPVACTVSSLQLLIAGNAASDNSSDTVVFTVRHNGNATSMSKSLTLSNTASGKTASGATTSGGFAVAAGDYLEYEVVETIASGKAPVVTYSTILTCD
jgi:hypothetical protein